MSRRLPSVNALKCFEVVAAQMSIRKAAAALRVSTTPAARNVQRRMMKPRKGWQGRRWGALSAASVVFRTPLGSEVRGDLLLEAQAPVVRAGLALAGVPLGA